MPHSVAIWSLTDGPIQPDDERDEPACSPIKRPLLQTNQIKRKNHTRPRIKQNLFVRFKRNSRKSSCFLNSFKHCNIHREYNCKSGKWKWGVYQEPLGACKKRRCTWIRYFITAHIRVYLINPLANTPRAEKVVRSKIYFIVFLYQADDLLNSRQTLRCRWCTHGCDNYCT